ncbi:hypothetical protein K61PH164C1_LOCUS33 [Klebsiella phage vB_Kpn_K61PH164C1]|uniref:Uncharacterized protein n=1 Tax=Klebsiella phage vB_Kpn_K61PH164C1 TaxID=3071663 RepID=A0AAV1MKI1_9CAUD|nr:hypothetical protein K61PH164C1_LOCUS33 [Klebsiella phage vB_Kpn_K61PH164C1]
MLVLRHEILANQVCRDCIQDFLGDVVKLDMTNSLDAFLFCRREDQLSQLASTTSEALACPIDVQRQTIFTLLIRPFHVGDEGHTDTLIESAEFFFRVQCIHEHSQLSLVAGLEAYSTPGFHAGAVFVQVFVTHEDGLEKDVVDRLLLFTGRAFNKDILITADVNNCAEDGIMRSHFWVLEYLTTASCYVSTKVKFASHYISYSFRLVSVVHIGIVVFCRETKFPYHRQLLRQHQSQIREPLYLLFIQVSICGAHRYCCILQRNQVPICVSTGRLHQQYCTCYAHPDTHSVSEHLFYTRQY